MLVEYSYQEVLCFLKCVLKNFKPEEHFQNLRQIPKNWLILKIRYLKQVLHQYKEDSMCKFVLYVLLASFMAIA